jgi:predicted HicB family RNase H-like nuclease
MTAFSHKGYSARVEFSPEDDLFVGRITGIDDIVTFEGESVKALKSAFREAVEDYLAACAEIGKKPQKSYSGQLMLRIDPAVHANAARAAELAGKSLNQWSEEALAKAATQKAA